MPTTLAETIRIADSYALGDPTQPELMSADHREHQDQYARDATGSSRRNEFRSRRREERPDDRYASNQVAAVVQDQPSHGNSQRQKNSPQEWTPRNEGKRQWTPEQKKQWQERPKYTFESMLDQPCKFHTPNPAKPANHTTRQCAWMKNAMGNPASMQAPSNQAHQQQLPQLTGANAQQLMLPPPPPRYDNSNRRDAVHQVINQGPDGRENLGNNGCNDYREHHQTYCVFTTEQQDKQSVQRRHMEVNAVMPAVPRYVPWSNQEITWSIRDHPKIIPNPGSYALV